MIGQAIEDIVFVAVAGVIIVVIILGLYYAKLFDII